jgi:hypothetical protein
MRMRAAVFVIMAVLFVLLGVLLTYWVNERLVPRESTAPDAGESREVTADGGSELPPSAATRPNWDWPASGELISEEELARLPAGIQDLVADPGWMQPYILPPSHREGSLYPLTIDIRVDAPMTADRLKYRVGREGRGAGGHCDLSMRAEIIPIDAVQTHEIVACLWAFRDGTIQYNYEGGASEVLTATHRYAPVPGLTNVYIVRVLVEDSSGERSFADSLPIEFVAE